MTFWLGLQRFFDLNIFFYFLMRHIVNVFSYCMSICRLPAFFLDIGKDSYVHTVFFYSSHGSEHTKRKWTQVVFTLTQMFWVKFPRVNLWSLSQMPLTHFQCTAVCRQLVMMSVQLTVHKHCLVLTVHKHWNQETRESVMLSVMFLYDTGSCFIPSY